MPDPSDYRQHEIHLGAQGRLVIPAVMRRALGFKAGDSLIVRVDGDRLVVEKTEAVKRRLKERFRRVPATVDMAAELIAERRRESSKDEDG